MSPNGELLQKTIGFQATKELLTQAQFAISDERASYDKNLKAFKEGNVNDSRLLDLHKIARDVFHDDSLTKILAYSSKIEYLDRLDPHELLNEKNIDFFKSNSNLYTPNSNFFQLLRNFPKETDSIARIKGFSSSSSEQMLVKAIQDSLWKEKKILIKNPNWDEITKKLVERYPDMDVKNIILDVQVGTRLAFMGKPGVGYFLIAKEYKNLIKYTNERIKILKVDLVDDDLSWNLNMLAYWGIFTQTMDQYALNAALKWTDFALSLKSEQVNPQILDTRACLLYKLNRFDEAIKQEEVAATVEEKLVGSKDFVSSYRKIVTQMKKREKIYLNDNTVWE